MAKIDRADGDKAQCDFCKQYIADDEPEVEATLYCHKYPHGDKKAYSYLKQVTLCCECFEVLQDDICETLNTCS